VLLVTDKVLQNQEMAARTKVTLLMKAFALERRAMLGIAQFGVREEKR
jgi:hypothetical protein